MPPLQKSHSYHCRGKQQLSTVASHKYAQAISFTWKSNLISKTSAPPFAPSSICSAVKATLMTSVTTSTAFFAANASDITCIKLFGTFCGLLVLVDYVLSVLLLSPVLCLYDRMMMRGSPSLFVSIQKIGVAKETAPSYRNIRDKILGNYIDFLYSFR